MIKIKSIDIAGVGPILGLHLDFDDCFNIICGPNGIGKTTILNCISDSFGSNKWSVRRNVSCSKGNWQIEYIDSEGQIKQYNHEIECRYLFEDDNQYSHADYSNMVITIKKDRSIPYQVLDSIPKDESNSDYKSKVYNNSGIPVNNVKGWFVNRYLFSDKGGSLTDEQVLNFQTAKDCFSLLNPGFSFAKVDASTFDIMLNTPTGIIELEQLSAGYASLAYIYLGIIKEIEYRFRTTKTKAADFDGIIVIDEIDIHLHPELQANVYNGLKKLFPKAQFFVTSHSPHLLQVASRSEIIPLVKQEDGTLKCNNICNNDYGFQGWTLEEILNDVMDMKDTRSEIYKKTIKEFEDALNSDNSEDAKNAFMKLDAMLHPNSYVRKILKLQMVSL